MTTRDRFLATMQERRQHRRESMDYAYLTRAARCYVWIMRKIPVTDWKHP